MHFDNDDDEADYRAPIHFEEFTEIDEEKLKSEQDR
jgi:hypothetical protein